MASPTAVVLDPAALAPDRTELALNTGSINVGPDGIDWGDAAVLAYKAELDRGEKTVGYRLPNRIITIPLLLGADGAAGYAAALADLMAKVALIQREGGWLRRGTGLYADIESAGLKLPDKNGHLGVEADVVLTLEASPDFYGEEVGNLTDDFSVDTIAAGDWVFDAGSGTLSVSGGQLAPTATGQKILYRPDRPMYDGEVTLKITTGASLTNFIGAVVFRNEAGDTLRFQQEATVLRIRNEAGTVVASVAHTPSANTDYWVRGRLEGNLATAEVFTSEPTPTSTPTATASATLTGADATSYGAGVLGYPGIRLVPTSGLDASLDDFSVAMNVFVETSTPDLRAALYGIEGDHPGRVRVKVNELDDVIQQGLLGGFQCRNRADVGTARLAYEAEALDPLDTAAIATLTGASGGASNNVVQHTNIGTNWTPVLGTDLGGTTPLTHVGKYRVWARVRAASTGVKLRFVYDVGDLVLPLENTAWTFPADADQFYVADLGQVQIDAPPAGMAHRWKGQIQAKGEAGGEDVYIDRVFFQPLDEAAWKCRAVTNPSQGLEGYAARDEFNQAAASLNGATAPTGGGWATTTPGTGADFATTGGGVLQRTEGADTATLEGRYAVLGAALTDQVAQVDFKSPTSSWDGMYQGVLARYTDTANWFMARYNPEFGTFTVQKTVGGTLATLDSTTLAEELTLGVYWSMRVLIDAAGRWSVWFWETGGSMGDPVLSGQHDDLATGGSLASGKPGIYDVALLGSPARTYDNFAAWAPTLDAVLYPSRAAEIRTDGFFREDSSGSAYGRVADDAGSSPRIPPSGIEGRSVGLLLLASRGDLDTLPDSGIDDKRVQVIYRPSWLFPPT